MGGLSQHAAGNKKADIVAGFFVRGLCPQPVMEGNRVELAGFRVCPRSGRIGFRSQGIQDLDQAEHFLLRLLPHRKHVSRVGAAGSVCGDVDRLSVAVPLKGFQAKFFHQSSQHGLVRRNPLAADLQYGAVDGVRPRPAAHTVTGFQHGHAQPAGLQLPGCGQPRRSGSDDDHVTLQRFHRFLSLRPRSGRALLGTALRSA